MRGAALFETPFTSEIKNDPSSLARALAVAGMDETFRKIVFDALRIAEQEAERPAEFREQVRWPLVLSLLAEVRVHRVTMSNGLFFEVSPDSRIEQALLLSPSADPDHVWEPQTTKLLMALAGHANHVIVGGAYIGDQALFVARVIADKNPSAQVHAFEPMDHAFRRLLRNIEINQLTNVRAHRLALWDGNDRLCLAGDAGLASALPIDDNSGGEVVDSITIEEYMKSHGLEKIDLIMLDTEGGEEKALRGAGELLSRPAGEAPDLIFELHRNFVDWSGGLLNTSIVKLIASQGYDVFAIRDLHGNYPMAAQQIEVIPADSVYLEGPPHGFNMLASKDPAIVERLNLCVVRNVSPKLILEKDPALHHPIGGFRSNPAHDEIRYQ